MDLSKRFLALFKKKKKNEDEKYGSPETLSRASTIMSQTLDLVQQQYKSAITASREFRARSGNMSHTVANWESLRCPNGAEYLGWTLEGIREGPGKMESVDYTYDGQWKRDLPHGNGMFYGKELIYEGNWERGLPHGNGVAMLEDKSKYVGEWKNGVPEGYGRLLTQEGKVYVGHFSNGLPNGEGIMITLEGVKVSCTFMDGVPFGVGMIEWPSEMLYVGMIVEGRPYGLGRLSNNEYVTLGLWKNDRLETRLKPHESIPDALRDDPAVQYILSL